MTRVIGLISGTSVDGIDAALVEITGTDIDLNVQLLAGATYPYPAALREQILEVCGGASLSMAELAQLDDAIALQFAQAAQAIQADNTPPELIGSHGQTVYHRPPLMQGSKGEGEQGKGGARERGSKGEGTSKPWIKQTTQSPNHPITPSPPHLTGVQPTTRKRRSDCPTDWDQDG